MVTPKEKYSWCEFITTVNKSDPYLTADCVYFSAADLLSPGGMEKQGNQSGGCRTQAVIGQQSVLKFILTNHMLCKQWEKNISYQGNAQILIKHISNHLYPF